ncbi:MAG: lipopolysaccharide biosynthesis protein [Bacteroidales bacterium]|nr:lipopolysaccharide biosynthesis protein [Bacteroidales bacterium]
MAETNYEKNKRIAGNTIMLFFRMFLMIFIGLFTSRIILQTLGEADYGTFNAVGGVIAFCSLMSGAVSAAIMRFLTFSLGEGDPDNVHRVFSSSVILQLFLCLLIGVLVETAGLWWLNNRMVIPPGRLGAARWVLHCSLAIMAVNLLSAPYNAVIVAHEKMSAFAFISILEALLKLLVAISLMVSSFDKLKTYAMLMLMVSLIVRFTYSSYCVRHFPEVRGRLVFDRKVAKDMSGFIGWNFFSTSATVFVGSGVNLLVNKYFGVLVNAARGVTGQVEATVRPFALNFLSALNPQLTKSYAEGNKEYTFDLVRKGVKIASLMLIALAVPIIIECDYLLGLWLKDVPEYTVMFVRIALVCIVVDLGLNSPRQLIISSGKIKAYCLVVGLIRISSFLAIWILFEKGFPPQVSYWVMVILETIVAVVCLAFCKVQEGFPLKDFLLGVLLPIIAVTLVASCSAFLVTEVMDSSFLRLVLVTLTSTGILGGLSYLFVLTEGEKSFIMDAVLKVIGKAHDH